MEMLGNLRESPGGQASTLEDENTGSEVASLNGQVASKDAVVQPVLDDDDVCAQLPAQLVPKPLPSHIPLPPGSPPALPSSVVATSSSSSAATGVELGKTDTTNSKTTTVESAGYENVDAAIQGR